MHSNAALFAELLAGIVIPIILFSWLSMRYTRWLGYRTTLVLGVIAVPIHELSHLVSAWLLGNKIIAFKLYAPSADGTLGYVSYQYRKTAIAPFKNLIISLAPLAGGLFAFWAVTIWLRPDLLSMIYILPNHVGTLSTLQDGLMRLFKQVFTNGGFVNTLSWLLLSLTILMFSAPSRMDFQGCRQAVIITVIVAVLFIVGFTAKSTSILMQIEPYVNFFSAILISMLVLTLCLFLAVYAVRWIILKRKSNVPLHDV